MRVLLAGATGAIGRPLVPALAAARGGTTRPTRCAGRAPRTCWRPLPMPRWLLRLISPYLACLLVDTSMRASAARAARELAWTPAHRSVPDGLAADLAGRG